MRKAEFEVPSEAMAAFAQAMAERELGNSVVGTNDENEILVEVLYEKEETEQVDELEEILANLREEIDEDEDEDDDE